MQANNQALGSPSNRINISAHWAAEGLNHTPNSVAAPTLKSLGLRSFVLEQARLVLFKVVLVFVDIGFAFTQVRQYLYKVFGSNRKEGFEDILQRQVTELARDELGVELDDSAFSG